MSLWSDYKEQESLTRMVIKRKKSEGRIFIFDTGIGATVGKIGVMGNIREVASYKNKMEKQLQKKLSEMAPRRISDRLTLKRLQQEEE
eukprot:g36282.t1